MACVWLCRGGGAAEVSVLCVGEGGGVCTCMCACTRVCLSYSVLVCVCVFFMCARVCARTYECSGVGAFAHTLKIRKIEFKLQKRALYQSISRMSTFSFSKRFLTVDNYVCT
jgi:hypothetical protein